MRAPGRRATAARTIPLPNAKKKKRIMFFYLRDTLRLPAEGLLPSAHPRNRDPGANT